MKKHFFVVFMLIFALVGSLFAQERTITGTVTSAEDGLSLPGVNVVVKGTGIGTITDVGGQYSIAIPSDAQALGFSFIGMQPQEVAIGSSNVIDVVLQVSVEELEEVVVTSLGIKREKKALGYSVTQVSGDDFVEAREVNIANSLSGKVAGVSVSSIATGPSGSSRVIIRGNTSLTAQNQPLYVVDGIPIDNTQMGAAGMWGGADLGDGVSSLSPDNIESISVLKGNAAAALYGARASNGVILITTRQGNKSKGIGVEFTTNFVTERQVDYTDFQKEYGSGDRGLKPAGQNEAIVMGLYAWGAKLDGTSVIQYDGVS
ncbi:MAG: TonB-dependent receptor plug domain-containing protein, partial [Bacteroidota bacterium]|nr:TonB-dependent receptor plug domain-containing protein [Bacteroidota bacterium]